MNHLQIGLAPKTFKPAKGFLLIDDDPKFPNAKLFDPLEHTFNPGRMDYRTARYFADLLFGDAGKETLTVRNGKRALTRLLIKSTLDELEPKSWGKPADDEKEAIAAIDDMMLSPVIQKGLAGPLPRWFKSGASIIARLDRAQLGEYDARIIAALLVFQFKGQVIIPDFGFYARPFHSALIREKRLMAGVYTLSELDDKMRALCLLMPKEGRQCSYDDAVTLAKYAALVPQTVEFNDFLAARMSGLAAM